jgi:hypothetical protein
VTFTPELRLALDCCRRNFQGGTNEAIVSPSPIDWPRFLRLVRFHRIEGLTWNALSDTNMPAGVRAELSDAASAIAAQNLRATAECRELLHAFDAAGVPLLFLKGLTLGALAHGNASLKAAIDIDLLIDPGDLGKAADLLRESGHALVTPRDSPADQVLHGWHRGWKESVWAKNSPPLQIDLHTRTADNPRLIPGIGVHSPRQWVEIADGVRLPTLADNELFAYLAVHGASSAWFRLKWIADFAALLHGRTADEIEGFYGQSQRLGAGRAAGQALLLADELFGTLRNNPDLRSKLSRDSATRKLCRAGLQLVTREPAEPTERRFGTFVIHWTQFLLLPGLGYRLSELSRQTKRLLDRFA